MTTTRLLLVGGGHAHVEVLRRFAERREPGIELSLVSTDAALTYSGMLPGVVAGNYEAVQAQIPLAPLAQAAGARFVCGHVVAVDLYTKIVRLASGEMEPFDGLSLDVGAAPDMSVPGAALHALPVKPFPEFLSAWNTLQADVAGERVRNIAVVGGGAGGVEMLLAMQFRLAAQFGPAAPRFTLLTDSATVLPEHVAAVQRRLAAKLVQREVVLKPRSPVTAVESGALMTAAGVRIASDRIVWATGAAPQRWLAASGLACDERGFVRVDDCLQSASHPFVFAAGDCASQDGHPHPRSGVYAVRQGPVLAANLRHAVRREALQRYRPQRTALAIITTGGRHAVATRSAFVAEGDWVWRWKDRIDRAFVARYQVVASPTDG